jgi:hypothetical protein
VGQLGNNKFQKTNNSSTETNPEVGIQSINNRVIGYSNHELFHPPNTNQMILPLGIAVLTIVPDFVHRLLDYFHLFPIVTMEILDMFSIGRLGMEHRLIDLKICQHLSNQK